MESSGGERWRKAASRDGEKPLGQAIQRLTATGGEGSGPLDKLVLAVLAEGPAHG